MKLRLAAGVVRLRILRPELAALHAGETLRERVRLAPGKNGCITYELSIGVADQTDDVHVMCDCGALQIHIAPGTFTRWWKPDQVGIYASVDVGETEPLRVVLEKDFACLDRSDADNRDTFEHPHSGAVC